MARDLNLAWLALERVASACRVQRPAFHFQALQGGLGGITTRLGAAWFSAHQGFLGGCQFGAAVSAWEQVAVAVGRDLMDDGGLAGGGSFVLGTRIGP